MTKQADAAMTQQAYWVVRANSEGIIPAIAEGEPHD